MKSQANQIFSVITAIALIGSISQVVIAPQPSTAKPMLLAKAESKGGQVVETQGYHLEFVPKKTAKGMHLDFYLQRSDNHDPIANANVKAEITMPEGKKQTASLKYNAKDKHYTALLETKATGDFKVVMLSDIAGKKVNGRFSFKR
jgi:hypothetical protein